MRHATLTALVIALVSSHAVGTEELIPPAEGFSWQEIPEIRAKFVLPNGWYFRRDTAEGRSVYLFSSQELEDGERPRVGMTLTVLRHMGDARAFVYDFITDLTQENEHIASWDTKLGKMHGRGCLVRGPGKRKKKKKSRAFQLHALAIANTRTGTVYTLLFESPDEEFDENWEAGKIMLQRFLLDDEF